MKKLILFGDSHMGRVGRDLIIELESKLNNEYEVYNCAAGGWNSADILKRASYLSQLKPDVIIISDGTNDTNPKRYVSLDDLVQNMRDIINAFQDSEIIFMPPVPMNEDLLIEEDHDLSNATLKQYHDALMGVCKEQGVKSLNSWSIYWPLLTSKTNYHDLDGLHLDDQGYSILFDEIARVVKA